MRLGPRSLVLLLLPALSALGCTKVVPASPEVITISISVDMPKVQTMQFLRQSASTLKFKGVSATAEDIVVAESSKVVVSGPVAGPVTAVFSGDSDSVNKWSQMILDKMPSKKL